MTCGCGVKCRTAEELYGQTGQTNRLAGETAPDDVSQGRQGISGSQRNPTSHVFGMLRPLPGP